MRITSADFFYVSSKRFHRSSLFKNIRGMIGRKKRSNLFFCLIFVQWMCSSPVIAVQVVREGETVSVSGLGSPAGSSGQSTQVYPAKSKTNPADVSVNNKASNRVNSNQPTGRDVLAATDGLSDFVDPPKGYDTPSDDKENIPSSDFSSVEPIDSNVPLDQIPVDKINRNAAPVTSDRSNPQWELIRQLSSLQQEVSELRGKLEQQAQQISVMEAQQKQRYLDLDSRLEALQGSISISSGSQATHSSTAQQSNDASEDEASAKQIASSSQPSAQPIVDKPADSSDSANMLKDYEAAQQLLKEKKLKSAKTAFNEFTNDYPDSNLTGDAHYWLGEIYLASQPSQEAAAKTEFSKVVDAFADSKKVPHALYKLSLLEIRGGSKARAKTLLLKLRKEHPTSAPAKLVDAQLKYLKDNP